VWNNRSSTPDGNPSGWMKLNPGSAIGTRPDGMRDIFDQSVVKRKNFNPLAVGSNTLIAIQELQCEVKQFDSNPHCHMAHILGRSYFIYQRNFSKTENAAESYLHRLEPTSRTKSSFGTSHHHLLFSMFLAIPVFAALIFG